MKTKMVLLSAVMVSSLMVSACDDGEGETTVPTADPGEPPVVATTFGD